MVICAGTRCAQQADCVYVLHHWYHPTLLLTTVMRNDSQRCSHQNEKTHLNPPSTAHPPMETANRRSCRPSSGLTIHCPLKCPPETSQAALHPRATLPHTVRSASDKSAVSHCDGCAELYLLAVVGRTVQWLLDCHCRMTSKPPSHPF